jgi:hypothetical protein
MLKILLPDSKNFFLITSNELPTPLVLLQNASGFKQFVLNTSKEPENPPVHFPIPLYL